MWLYYAFSFFLSVAWGCVNQKLRMYSIYSDSYLKNLGSPSWILAVVCWHLLVKSWERLGRASKHPNRKLIRLKFHLYLMKLIFSELWPHRLFSTRVMHFWKMVSKISSPGIQVACWPKLLCRDLRLSSKEAFTEKVKGQRPYKIIVMYIILCSLFLCYCNRTWNRKMVLEM